MKIELKEINPPGQDTWWGIFVDGFCDCNPYKSYEEAKKAYDEFVVKMRSGKKRRDTLESIEILPNP